MSIPIAFPVLPVNLAASVKSCPGPLPKSTTTSPSLIPAFLARLLEEPKLGTFIPFYLALMIIQLNNMNHLLILSLLQLENNMILLELLSLMLSHNFL